MRWLDGITNSMDMSLSKLWELATDKQKTACCSPWSRKESDMTEQLSLLLTRAERQRIDAVELWF